MKGLRQYSLWTAGWLGVLPMLTVVFAADMDNKGELIKQVEAAACGSSTVGTRLQAEITAHSRRDLGWQVFVADGGNDVERALRVSKSMDLRYRWRLDAAGSIAAQSEAAKKLCE